MALINFLNESVVLPLFDKLSGTTLHKDLFSSFDREKWTKKQWREYQDDKFLKLIAHLYNNVPFYTDFFNKYNHTLADFKSIDDIVKLPIMTKKIIRENINNGRLVAKNIDVKDCIKNNSSGSTGEPLRFYLTKEAESIKKATAIRGWYWMGFRLGDKILRVSTIPRHSKLKKIQDLITRSYFVHAPLLNDETYNDVINKIFKYKPKVLRIYPDPLLFLCKYIEKNNITLPKCIQAINTTGSTLLDETRELAEKLFDCQVFDSFSCEGGAVSFETKEKNGYYSADDYAITEVLDDDGCAAKHGRLITTDLCNYITPFVRYDTQDVIELFDKANSDVLSNNMFRLKRIYGRNSDVLVTSDGRLLVANNFTGLFQSIEGLEQFQILQKEINQYKVLIKCSLDAKGEEVTEKIDKIMRQLIVIDDVVDIQIVNEIPMTKSGKRRFLIRDEKVKFIY